MSSNADLLHVSNLQAGYAGKTIVANASFDVGSGQFVCILGSNGCGKSTTLKTILGILPALGGSIEVEGEDTIRYTDAQRARVFAYIPQAHTPPFPFRSFDVVALGRTPHMGFRSKLSKEDERLVWECMEKMGVADYSDIPYTQLSGGQQQLVLISRALAQQPQVLVMDEPTACLDFGNQQLVLRHMKNLKDAGTSVLMVTHDPAHALLCADSVVVMEKGSVVAQGAPEKTVTTEVLERIYSAQVEVVEAQTSRGIQRACVQML